MLHVIMLLCLFGSALAEARFGRCRRVQTVPNFQPSLFMGRWYEVQRFNVHHYADGKCMQADYSWGNDKSVRINSTYILIDTGELKTIKAITRIPNLVNPARQTIEVDGLDVGFELQFWMVGTDYENYAVIYNCVDLFFITMTHAWVLTRERNPQPAVLDEAKKVVERTGLRWSSFTKTDQSNCE